MMNAPIANTIVVTMKGALETLKEGLQLYPHSVELYVGLGLHAPGT
jgi:hypothetical protein